MSLVHSLDKLGKFIASSGNKKENKAVKKPKCPNIYDKQNFLFVKQEKLNKNNRLSEVLLFLCITRNNC